MPFTSRRQARAAFGGHIPGLSRAKAEAWADETDFDALPDRAPAEKGKPTLRSKSASPMRVAYIAKKLREQLIQSGTSKNVYDAVQGEHDRSQRNKHAEDFVLFCTKMAFAVPRPGQVSMAAKHVGSYSGKTTTNFLKPPGPTTTTSVVNPRLSLRSAMTKSMRP